MRRKLAALAVGVGLAVSAPAALAVEASAPTPPPAPTPLFLPGFQLPDLGGLLNGLIPNLSQLLPNLSQLLPDLSQILPGLDLGNLPALPDLSALPLIPNLPAECLPPGLVPGGAVPAGYQMPSDWRPSLECATKILSTVLPGLFPAPPAQPATPPPAGTPEPPPVPETPGAPEGEPPAVTPPTAPPPVAEAPPFNFGRGFFLRLWNMTGEILGADLVGGQQVLDVDVRRMFTPPAALRAAVGEVLDSGAQLLIPKTVKITRHGVRIRFSELDADDIVRVTGKFLPQVRWVLDEDGERVPTFRVKRVIVS
jgi:hypothetical protein